ncbi:DNA repair protein RecN [Sneathiella chinensis]|uniref:DNA repair protein RecN n=1 Tax=Sneathiella chinensis TaxID=349750 RepID=A0ABQ5U291_9PROT|nr:DNA repair protein RecN [Sneathiella chinensis]GLQ06014.1 DNA repair protein RecN [Sneathiella chinensis]
MLATLSIRNIVLIDRLTLSFEDCLCVLTGETGAGKSILLDSLALALGARADAGLVRAGEDKASVIAEFILPDDHPVFDLLEDVEVTKGEPLILRRNLNADGRSRASINDQSVSAALLRSVGDMLVEIHGQNAERGLLDANGHRRILDLYGRLIQEARQVGTLYETMRHTAAELEEAIRQIEQAREDEEYLRHVVGELEELAPQDNEEEELSEKRSELMHAEKIAEALRDAEKALNDNGGIEGKIRTAVRAIERVVEKAGGKLDPVLDGLERASIEMAEAAMTITSVGQDLDIDPSGLEAVEERLFALRAAARKHKCEVSGLPAVMAAFRAKLNAVEHGEAEVIRLQEAATKARQDYIVAASALREKRVASGQGLDQAVMAELEPLKLGSARFETLVHELPEESWSPAGMDKVEFQVATNPGSAPGPLIKIASGGELSRFMLALKVVLAQSGSAPTLVFDEVDRGVGGATADAVGERLSRLSEGLQVLVITHSPQVAAAGVAHFNIRKSASDEVTTTVVDRLTQDERKEEIARMLSGANITNEARAAAQSLIEG